MFTYLDPSIRRRLIKEEKLIRIGYEGEQLDSEAPQAPGEVIINLLGPIPMPIDTLEGRIIVQWYAAVRSTELQQVEALANKLTDPKFREILEQVGTDPLKALSMIGKDPEMQKVMQEFSGLMGEYFTTLGDSMAQGVSVLPR